MVSLWPFNRNSTSAASFEKTLSALSTKISNTSAKNDRLRQRARRLKVGWSIYGGFTYILTVLILLFVTGRPNWGAVEYSILAGGPVLLYVVRQGLDTWYNYRISNSQDYLDGLYKERDATIEKLKAATKYNSTQQLLEKYGSPKPRSPKEPQQKAKSPKAEKPGDRVFIQPPPTANIPRNQPQQPRSPSSQQSPSLSRPPPPNAGRPISPQGPPITEEFAPNAFSGSEPSQYASAPTFGEPRWYDRILDALLGEDETQAKNRFALICQNCKLVNGQAPPGARSLEDVGRWRCASCHTWNGVERVESPTEQLVKQIREEARPSPKEEEYEEEEEEQEGSGEDAVVVDADDQEELGEDLPNLEDRSQDEEDTPAESTRSKGKRKGKKSKKT